MTTTTTLTDHIDWLTLNLIDRMEIGYEVDQQYCWELRNAFDDDDLDDTFVYLEQLGAITRALDIAIEDVYQRRLDAIDRACSLALTS